MTRCINAEKSVSIFVDTNVLVYARDLSGLAKHERAHEWMSALLIP